VLAGLLTITEKYYMKLIHTSDWHLGNSLHSQKRYDEFGKFFNWLSNFIDQENGHVLLVAGDIFDTGTPGNKALELYYNFLHKISSSNLGHVVIIGGNHDSPTLLNAPKHILKNINIHVVGAALSNPEDEVIELKNSLGQVELIVCAVPYLRDRDVRISEAGESQDSKDLNLKTGISKHYQLVCDHALSLNKRLKDKVPIVAMGHLFTEGGRCRDDDGVRRIHMGNINLVQNDTFPDYIDYLALGHLHMPQIVKEDEFRRYSGSPVPMTFAETRYKKEIVTVTFDNTEKYVKTHKIPQFQKMETVEGDYISIKVKLNQLIEDKSNIWIEIIHDGDEIIPDLREELLKIVENSQIKILKISDLAKLKQIISRMGSNEELDDLTPEEVFIKKMETSEISQEDQKYLLDAFREIIQHINDSDKMAI
jgi:DNA repair protein SbcD/Mre11